LGPKYDVRTEGAGRRLYFLRDGPACYAPLRAVPHILGHHDNKLSPQHEAVIDAWWTRTKNLKEHPDFLLIIRARNQNLKDGSFDSWASSWEGTSEPGVVHYEASHYIDGVRRDLEIDVRAALEWMERQLTEIEADLPPRFDEREIEQTIRDDELQNLVETGIPPQRIAGSTISARIEAGALISFRRRPQPWQDGDVLEIFSCAEWAYDIDGDRTCRISVYVGAGGQSPFRIRARGIGRLHISRTSD
jgi:hypothetical protein